jgi:hypothetical protein
VAVAVVPVVELVLVAEVVLEYLLLLIQILHQQQLLQI